MNREQYSEDKQLNHKTPEELLLELQLVAESDDGDDGGFFDPGDDAIQLTK
jgi:hypothetical protein